MYHFLMGRKKFFLPPFLHHMAISCTFAFLYCFKIKTINQLIMDISPKYVPAEVERNWYEHWMNSGYFHSEPDGRKPYTVVLPPPNVTGVLHMGHGGQGGGQT